MKLPEQFISVDWGTTNFRLRVVETSSLEILSELQAGEGIRALNQQFAATTGEISRFDFFSRFLRTQLGQLPATYRDFPLVVSGMATSSIGMLELPYAEFPFGGNAGGLKWKMTTLWNGQVCILISGVRNSSSVMRGEETQACGLADRLAPYSRALLILPGTHCKHLLWTDKTFRDLQTFMTGEVFEALSTHTILAESIGAADWTAGTEEAFQRGVRVGWSGKMTAHLFSIRVGHLQGTTGVEENYFYLSGMLIGDELRYLGKEYDQVILAASGKVFGMYRRALLECIGSARLTCFDGAVLERALLAGQRKILLRYANN